MDRKWRTNRTAIDTVLSFPDFSQSLLPLNPSYDLASLTDLYSVYVVLHIEDKEWEIRWSEEGQFYFFIAKQTIMPSILPQQQPDAVPEGDEDMPRVRS